MELFSVYKKDLPKMPTLRTRWVLGLYDYHPLQTPEQAQQQRYARSIALLAGIGIPSAYTALEWLVKAGTGSLY